MLRFAGNGASDVGRVRPHNEDSGFVGPYLALVADGVGGAAAGEVASATAAYVVSAETLGHLGARPEDVLRRAVRAVRTCLRQGVSEDPTRETMATTLTALVCDGARVVLGHVGDSRAYLLRGGQLSQVSTDHTYVQQLLVEGRLTREQARVHPWRNVVLRSLGSDTPADLDDVEVVDLEALEGDRLLVCSDGLSDLVDDVRIAEVLLGLHDPHSAAAVLTQSALVAGGTDNVTCVVVDVVDGPWVVGDGRLLGAVRDVANIVDPAAVHLPV